MREPVELGDDEGVAGPARSEGLVAEVMVAAMPFAGHVAPMVQAAKALVAAGHRVRGYVGSAYAAHFAAVGATPVPWRQAPDFDERDLRATFPEVGRRDRLGVLANLEHIFVRSGVGQVSDLVAEYERAPWDLLVADSLSIGGALAAERLGTAWATLSVVPLSMPSRDLPPPGLPIAPAHGRAGRVRDAALRAVVAAATGRLRRAYRETRIAAGLTPDARRLADAWFSPLLVLALGVPDLESPRSDLPAQVHFLGAFPIEAGAIPKPAWWEEAMKSGRPVVHVTQGTFNVDPDELIRPALAALADRKLTVAVATGSADRDPLPFPIPANAYCAGLLPYPDLLPRTSVMITNGGWGGVLAALAGGIPLLVAGGELDKPAIAAMVARSGAGIDLRTGRPRPEAIARAVDRIEADPTFRRHAARLAAQFAEHDTAAELVALVGRLLETKAPVLRDHDPWDRSDSGDRAGPR